MESNLCDFFKLKTINMSKTNVSIDFEVIMKDDGKNSKISCYIPSINAYFSADNIDNVERKTKAFIKSFIGFYNENNQNLIP